MMYGFLAREPLWIAIQPASITPFLQDYILIVESTITHDAGENMR